MAAKDNDLALAKSSGSESSVRGAGPEKISFKELPIGVPPFEPRTEEVWADFKRQPAESWWRYSLRMCSEGHSVPDAFLTVAASQIGQIMLTCPNALWKAGMIPGSMFMGLTIFMALFTMYLMNVLYVEYKRAKMNAGQWTKDRPITQYHDVLGHHGGKWVRWIAQTIICLQLLGTAIAQIIACAADWYSIEKSISKREMQLIWGGILQVFVFFPTFKHFRVLNIMALVGTTFTAIFLLYESGIQGFDNISLVRLWPVESANGITSATQYFFTGSAVLLNALGGHAIAMEMMDAMQTPRQYTAAYTGGWAWTIFLVIPHSITINLAFPTAIGGADNVYGVIPMSKAKVASVVLMIGHQLAAYAYYLTPVMYMWEKAIGTHHKPWYIRLSSRIPVSLLVWFLAMAFPFYGAINSLMSAISVPFTAFALPAFIFWVIYRTQDKRDNAVQPPFAFLQGKNGKWTAMFVICFIAVFFYSGFGFAAIAYSLKSVIDNSKQFGVFARCYQCPPNYESLLKNPDNLL